MARPCVRMPTSVPSAATTGATRRRSAAEPLERIPRVDVLGQDDHLPEHDVLDLREAVDPREVLLGDDADGTLALDDDRRAVGALAEQDERLARGHVAGRA